MIFGVIAFIILAVTFIALVVLNSRRWAIALQQLYTREADKWLPGSSEAWKDVWVRILFQIMIVFAAAILILMAFSFIFGTIHSERNSAGQVEWSLQK